MEALARVEAHEGGGLEASGFGGGFSDGVEAHEGGGESGRCGISLWSCVWKEDLPVDRPAWWRRRRSQPETEPGAVWLASPFAFVPASPRPPNPEDAA